MSMQVNHFRYLILASLPLLLLVGLISVATWSGLLSTPLPTGSHLVLHQALTNIPPILLETGTATNQTLAEPVGSDPFFRNLKGGATKVLNSQEIANLEEIHLSTIAQGKQGRYCIVNGAIFNEGQEGKSFIVKEIAQGQVVFQTSLEFFSLIPGQKAAIQSGKLVPIAEDTFESQISSQKPVEALDEQQRI